MNEVELFYQMLQSGMLYNHDSNNLFDHPNPYVFHSQAEDWHKWANYDVNAAEALLYPGLQQRVEWSQQMMSTLYQNWYNSAPEQMKRAIEAGINPFVAASGIVGSGTGSVASAPNSAIGQGANNLNAASNALGTLGNVASQAVAAYDTLSTLGGRLDNLDASTKDMLSNAGFTDAETAGIMIDNKYRDENWLADLNIKRQNFENMKSEYDMITLQKEFVHKQLDWYDTQQLLAADESTARRLMLERQQFLLEQQGITQQLENGFTQKYWSHMSDPAEVALKNLFFRSMQSADPVEMFEVGYNAVVKYYGDKAYMLARGQYNADSDTIFTRSYNEMEGNLKATADNVYNAEIQRLKAEKDVQLQYGDRLAKLEANRERIVGMASIYSKNVDGVNGFVSWFLQALVKAPVDVFNQICQ